MADKSTAERWLQQLTALPTASGREQAVVSWVEKWVARRSDLLLRRDSGGNLLVTQKGRKRRPPVLAVAHMDHPAFVVTSADGSFEFRGGVDPPYFDDARVLVVSRPGGPGGTVVDYEPKGQTGTIEFDGEVEPGDIVMWAFGKGGVEDGILHAPACDDLGGAAAAIAALDRARRDPGLRHFGVLLTRAEEVGLIGALHAAKHGTIPEGSRLLSIETSRELANARIGDGPIIRIGDHSTVFDRDLSNRISRAARAAGLVHQRRLMDGGVCEGTAFGVYGYASTGLCLALGNYHNRGNLGAVETGDVAAAVPMLEEISLADFHGLVDLLILAVTAVDQPDSLAGRYDDLYESNSHYLG